MDDSVADKLAGLPRWAVVAFAARCARRVAPLFEQAWADAPLDDIEAVRRAAEAAESSAGSAQALASAGEKAKAADLAAHHAAFGDAESSASGAYEAAHAAANAAGAVAHPKEARTAAYYAAADARLALQITAGEDDSGIRADLDTLVEAAKKGRWKDDTKVGPDVFAPLPVRLPSMRPRREDEDEAARREAYFEWERRGRPELSAEEQRAMYLAALARVRSS